MSVLKTPYSTIFEAIKGQKKGFLKTSEFSFSGGLINYKNRVSFWPFSLF